MSDKILSVFIDESGDFGLYETHSPYYIVSLVLHNQQNIINDSINNYKRHIQNLGYKKHAVHTGPLIRRESIYKNDNMETRRQLFNAQFHFFRKLDIKYMCVKIKKIECLNINILTDKLSKELSRILHLHESFLNSFDRIIIYYDNGQTELTHILTTVFKTLYSQVEFRKVKPIDYNLFQIADLICTLELLAEKANTNSFSKSEIDFFGSIRNFKKSYLKYISKKRL